MENNLFKRIERSVSKKVGLSVRKLRHLGPDELRIYLEKKTGKKLKYSSEFPVIGRGNVLRDGIITTDVINREVDEILR